MVETAADRLVAPPSVGHRLVTHRRVRFGDVAPPGRVRLDALASYVQDLAADDTAGLMPDDEMVWVARRSVFEVRVTPQFLDDLEMTTWCGGLGPRWAERRVSMRNPRGALVEAAVNWVHVHPTSGRPLPLPDHFVERYLEASSGREVSGRLTHPSAPADDALVARSAWPLRATDFDLLAHVNNAAAWAMVEEVLADRAIRAPFRAEIEYRLPIEQGTEVEVSVVEEPEGFRLWAFGRPAASSTDQNQMLLATARVFPL